MYGILARGSGAHLRYVDPLVMYGKNITTLESWNVRLVGEVRKLIQLDTITRDSLFILFYIFLSILSYFISIIYLSMHLFVYLSGYLFIHLTHFLLSVIQCRL